MKQRKDILARCALPLAISSCLAGTTAYAQQDTPVVEEVIVTGIRASLTASADIKRDSSGVVDAITAEDIGKFADTNLAESLQRITGVSIDRSNNEGNQVTVRGFGPTFNLVTLNGRQMPTSSALSGQSTERSFNFQELSADLVSGVEVYKTGKAHVSSGGLGATINLKTAKPLELDEFVAQGSIKGVIDTSVKDVGDDVTPEVSGLISKSFADDTFGLLLSGSYSKRNSHFDRAGVLPGTYWERRGDWFTGPGVTNRPANNVLWSPQTTDYDESDFERERINGQLVMQFRPTDSATATLDYTVSRFDNSGLTNRSSFWFDNNISGRADENGTVLTPSRELDEINFWAFQFEFETVNDSFGFNLDFDVNDNLSMVFDIHNSVSHANPGGLVAEQVANLRSIRTLDTTGPNEIPNGIPDKSEVTVSSDFTGDVPIVTIDDSRFPNGQGGYDPRNIEADLYQERGKEIRNEITQVQLHGAWEADLGPFKGAKFGISNTLYELDSLVIQEDNFSLGADDDPGTVNNLSLATLGFELTPGENGFEYLPRYSASEFVDLVYAQDLRGNRRLTTAGAEEDTTALYLALDFEQELSSIATLRANLGVRYEETDVDSFSVGKQVVGFRHTTTQELSPISTEEEIAESLDGSYDNTLPNLDLSLELNEDIVVRASYSATIARANPDAFFPSTSITSRRAPNGPFQANQGNPSLLPFESTNFDFSVEWYYDESSYISAGYFKKDVENFIFNRTEARLIESPEGVLTNPSASPRSGCPSQVNPACVSRPTDPAILWNVNTPVNGDQESTVDGAEFNFQHVFGESGFGVILNATIVDSDDSFDVNDLDGNDFALVGLSDSANAVAFYETDRFQARIAYNWRDQFLRSIIGRENFREPVFVDEYSQIDISTSYEVSDGVTIFLEGLNITDEEARRFGRQENQLLDLENYGPRYNIGVSAKF